MDILSIICLILSGACIGIMAGMGFSADYESSYQKIKIILSYAIPIIIFVLVFLIPVFWELLI
jgi:hypothetical protein